MDVANGSGIRSAQWKPHYQQAYAAIFVAILLTNLVM
jgi:hypothetical protein